MYVENSKTAVSSNKQRSTETSGTSLSAQSIKTQISENPPKKTMHINTRTYDKDFVQPDPKGDPSDEYMFDGDKDDTVRYVVFFI